MNLCEENSIDSKEHVHNIIRQNTIIELGNESTCTVQSLRHI